MAYFLLSEDPGEKPAASFEEFKQRMLKCPTFAKASTTTETVDCFLCQEPIKATNKASISRKCRCDDHPCEGHACKCTLYQCCFTCTITHLWGSTSSTLRERGRLRAKCPFCKAEFCPKDVVRS